ncbi:MAG: ABC transporter substrate-binding protein [Nitrososphaerales archaeon]
MKRIVRIIIILFLGLLLIRPPASMNLRTSSADSSCPANDILHWTLVVPPDSINPNTLSNQALLIFMEYYGVQGDEMPNGTIDPLTSVTDVITHNANYTVWMFHLKPLIWSNGANLTANDVLESFSPKFYYNTTYDVLGIGPEVKTEYAANSSTAVFVLNAPDAMWANKMSVPSVGFTIFPKSTVDQNGPAYPNLGTNIDLGPFYIANYTAGSFTMTMLRNPYYKPQPTICKIEINFVESLSQTTESLLAGTSDWAQIEPSNAQSILNNPNLHLFAEPAMETTTLEYNNTVYPFNMTEFRQALVFGINQSQLVQQAFNGYGYPAYDSMGFVPSESHSIWYTPNIMKYDYNTTKALSLLSSIGITKGSDGMLHYPNGTAVSITLWAPTDTTVDTIGSTVLQANLQKLGITVNVQSVSIASIIGDLASNVDGIARTGMILLTSTADDFGFILDNVLPGPAIYLIAPVSGYTWEWPAFVQNEYQSNISAIDNTDNQSQLQQYSYNIEALNAQYLPSIILAYPDELYAYSTQRFTGWVTSPNNFVYGSTTLNPNSLLTLVPVSSGASTSTTPTVQTTSAASTNVSLSNIATSSATQTSTSGGSNLTTIAVIGVVVIIVIVGLAFAMMRRKPKPSAT